MRHFEKGAACSRTCTVGAVSGFKAHSCYGHFSADAQRVASTPRMHSQLALPKTLATVLRTSARLSTRAPDAANQTPRLRLCFCYVRRGVIVTRSIGHSLLVARGGPAVWSGVGVVAEDGQPKRAYDARNSEPDLVRVAGHLVRKKLEFDDRNAGQIWAARRTN